ncbi:MAG TPA: adenylate/guanylate cyclase domain-containing protein [Nostocaceae cyanobacterium]|nr:adenylate/guanylate cyclase domain-containing protein [Nostocaceae cyanobacterium]
MWAKLKQQIWRWRGVVIAVPNVTLLLIGLRFSGWLQRWELTALDQFFILRPQESVENRIVIVEINEEDVRRQKQWPMSDAEMARLLNNIKQQKPRAIGLDIYRDLPVNPGTNDLLKVFESTPNLVGVQKFADQDDKSGVDAPPLLKQRQQVGANNLPVDGDGKIRRGLLYVNLPNNEDEVIESFGLKLALLYLKDEKITAKPSAKNPNYLQLGQGVFNIFEANDGGYVRADSGSYQVLLNYRGGIEKFTKLTLTDVLNNRVPQDVMRHKIVLIGSTSEGLKDFFYTPYTNKVFAAPERMAGVVIHANLISQILSAALDNRPLIQTLPDYLEGLWIFFWSIIGATLNWQQRYNNNRPKYFLIAGTGIFVAGCSLVGIGFLAFLAGWWIPVVPPLLALTGSAIAINQYIARSAANMQKTFGRYLTEEIVTNLIETPTGLKLGGERRKVTVLVSDVRGFSALSEELPPEQVVNILNMYLGVMTEVINQYKGTINEFMGDGIFVLFGAPISRPDDSRRAIACAVAMQLAMEQVNAKNRQLNLPILEMGIGINTGEVVAGNIGSQKRAQYTVIGSHVNLAARVESYTVGGQILISEYTWQDADIELRIDGKLQVEPKGIKHPITLYEIGGIGGEFNLFLPQDKENIVNLNQELPIEYVVLQGKHADGMILSGVLVGLSENGAELQTNQDLEILNNLKLKLLRTTEFSSTETDIYAKVVKKSPHSDHNFIIRFTAVPQEAITFLNHIRQIAG